ncbi:hypothetical protein [Cohnella fermenti]|nr:hypothetical protein [Cohnella fermenti]
MNSTDTGAGDLYEMMFYLVLILISMVVMVKWLKRRAKRKRRNDGG